MRLAISGMFTLQYFGASAAEKANSNLREKLLLMNVASLLLLPGQICLIFGVFLLKMLCVRSKCIGMVHGR